MRGKNSEYTREKAAKAVMFLFFGAVAVAAAGAIVMYLWNAILPRVTGVKALGYWDALGLLILCKILFGGFHKGGGKSHSKRFAKRKKWMEKWHNMSPEEKAEMKERWKERCRKGPRDVI